MPCCRTRFPTGVNGLSSRTSVAGGQRLAALCGCRRPGRRAGAVHPRNQHRRQPDHAAAAVDAAVPGPPIHQLLPSGLPRQHPGQGRPFDRGGRAARQAAAGHAQPGPPGPAPADWLPATRLVIEGGRGVSRSPGRSDAEWHLLARWLEAPSAGHARSPSARRKQDECRIGDIGRPKPDPRIGVGTVNGGVQGAIVPPCHVPVPRGTAGRQGALAGEPLERRPSSLVTRHPPGARWVRGGYRVPGRGKV